MTDKKFKSKPKFSTSNNSTGIEQKKLLQLLQKMILEKSGTVAYIHESFHLKNKHSKNPKVIRKTATTYTHLNPTVFIGRSPNDLINLFESTMHDLGATTYIIS